MSLRHRLGALVYDWPRFLRHLARDWRLIRNRDEAVSTDGRGVRCDWVYSSDLHLANVYPVAGRALMRRAFGDWPIAMTDAPASVSPAPAVSFLIGHRGLERLPNLLATLRCIAGQEGAAVECIVVEQSAVREVESLLPPWVRYLHTPVPVDLDYCRAATFNAGARLARGEVLIVHDNDILVPARYAAEILARVREGWDFVDPKRFLFDLAEPETRSVFDGAAVPLRPATVRQNLKGGTVAIAAAAYRAVGGYDESFVGWGGEDLELWERAREQGRVYEFGWLPVIHLWHRPQAGKVRQETAPAQLRYYELRGVPAVERIARLRSTNFPNEK
jgi:hypothetical protein